MKCTAIILSGGTGSRMKMDIPKQYIEVAGNMIITESIRPFITSSLVSDIRIVADAVWHEKICEEYAILSKEYVGELGLGKSIGDLTDGLYKFCGFSSPGENRQLSILNALSDIENDTEPSDVVIIHDAARPLVTVDMIDSCIRLVCNESNTIIHDGVMPVLPMKDTVYFSEDGSGISKLLNRDKIFAGQAPEAYVFGKYIDACRKLLPDDIMAIRGSTEPAIMAGMDIVMIPGDEGNFKITTKEDLERYKKILENNGD